MPAEERGEQASRHLTPDASCADGSSMDASRADDASAHDPFRLRPARRAGSQGLHISESDLLSTLQLAHELRSPLASIQSALDMLLQGYAKNDPELHDEMLSLARDRVLVMLGQVNDFLRLGAVQHSEVERKVRPVQLLDVLKRLAPEKRVRAKWRAVEFRLDVPDSLPMINATPEDMEHLLSNLINNAIKYNKPGGSVTVSLKQEGDRVLGTVEDTGIGIAPEDIPRIFEEFYRSEAAKDMDAHGTGLGLSIVKRIVDVYDGQLYVESEVGKGSRFSFAFPQIVAVEEPVEVEQRGIVAQAEVLGRLDVVPVPGVAGERPRRERIRIFHHLHREVVSVGLCGKCGGCVSFCSAGTLNALEMGGGQGPHDDLPRYADRKKCLACGICYMICPVTRDLDAEVRETFGWRAPIGIYRAVRSARAMDEKIRAVATDGGVVTALLIYMLEKRLIDGAIVSQKSATISPSPLIATTREELLAAAGSCFAGSAHLEELGDRFTTYSPTLSAVKGLETRHLQRVAMVGTPCQIRSIKKMQCLGVVPAHVILYTIGLFCMENFIFDAAGRRKLEEIMSARHQGDMSSGDKSRTHSDARGVQPTAGTQVRFQDIAKLNLKEDMIVTLADGQTLYVPFEELDEVARPACLACTDFANDYADLSAGGLGSVSGYTTILIRTPKGNRVYSDALGQGYLEERRFRDRQVRSQEAELVDKVVSFAQRKRARGEARRRELTAAVVTEPK